MATVAILLHHERGEAHTLAVEAVDWLTAREHEARLPKEDAAIIDRADLGVEEEALAGGCDLAISLGGDGTMLRTVDVVAPKGVPVLGVNVGQLGYLTEVEPTDLFDALDRVFRGEQHLEEPMMLDVRNGDGLQKFA